MKKIETKNISDKEILDKLPEDKVEQIQNLLKKHLKKDVDLEKIVSKDESDKSSEEEDKKGDETNEAAGTLAVIGIASLVPLILEAGGNLLNIMNNKLGFTFTDEQWKQYKFYQRLVGIYKELLNKEYGDLHWEGKTIRYTWKNWPELGKKADEILKNLGFNNPKIYYKSGLSSEKKHESFQFGYLMTYEKFVNEESDTNKKEDQGKDTWKEAQKVFGNDHHHGAKHYDLDWKPSLTKEGDKEFIKNELVRIKEHMKEKLPIDGIGDGLISAAHKLHALYTYPIRLVLKGIAWATNWKWMKNKENREIAANAIYAVSMVAIGGILVWDKIQHLKGVSSFGELIVKNYKLGVSTKDTIKEILEIIKKS